MSLLTRLIDAVFPGNRSAPYGTQRGGYFQEGWVLSYQQPANPLSVIHLAQLREEERSLKRGRFKLFDPEMIIRGEIDSTRIVKLDTIGMDAVGQALDWIETNVHHCWSFYMDDYVYAGDYSGKLRTAFILSDDVEAIMMKMAVSDY